MKINYLVNVETLEELKSLYKKLALLHHPDRGGDVEIMKVINNEWDYLFPQYKNKHKNREGQTYEKDSSEAPEEFKNIISALVRMSGVVVEVCGCFIWLTGNTKEHKEAIKALGFKWSRNKSAWYKSPAGYRRYGKRDMSLDDIRASYGSTVYSGSDEATKVISA